MINPLEIVENLAGSAVRLCFEDMCDGSGNCEPGQTWVTGKLCKFDEESYQVIPEQGRARYFWKDQIRGVLIAADGRHIIVVNLETDELAGFNFSPRSTIYGEPINDQG